jgi:hypothetical protein
MFEDDFILRMVKQLGDFLTRIKRRKDDGQLEEALDTIDEAYDDLLGRDAELYRSLDPATLVSLCRHRDRAKAVARLCREEASVYELQKDLEGARAGYRRARAIYQQTLSAYQGREDDRDCQEGIRELDALLGALG